MLNLDTLGTTWIFTRAVLANRLFLTIMSIGPFNENGYKCKDQIVIWERKRRAYLKRIGENSWRQRHKVTTSSARFNRFQLVDQENIAQHNRVGKEVETSRLRFFKAKLNEFKSRKLKEKEEKLTFTSPRAAESDVVLKSHLVKAIHVQVVSELLSAIVRIGSPIRHTTEIVEVALQVDDDCSLLYGDGVEHGDFHAVNATLLIRMCQVGDQRVRVYECGQIDWCAIAIVNDHLGLSGVSRGHLHSKHHCSCSNG